MPRYNHAKWGGDGGVDPNHQPRHKDPCGVPTCERPAYAKGYCHAHYQRLRDSGDVQADKPLRTFILNRGGRCSVATCRRKGQKLGMCPAHYAWVLKYGHPDAERPIAYQNRLGNT